MEVEEWIQRNTKLCVNTNARITVEACHKNKSEHRMLMCETCKGLEEVMTEDVFRQKKHRGRPAVREKRVQSELPPAGDPKPEIKIKLTGFSALALRAQDNYIRIDEDLVPVLKEAEVSAEDINQLIRVALAGNGWL